MKLVLLIVLFQFSIANAQDFDREQLLSDVKILSSDAYEGRKTGTAGSRMAAAYIINRFSQAGLQSYTNSYKMNFRASGRRNEAIEGTNVIGYVAGFNAETIVISAHYDHLGAVRGQIHNGADDNASGIGALLSLAAYFAKNKPNYTLIFAAFDAEESGLLGARAFLSEPPVPLKSIRLNLNMDMISRNERGELYAAGSYHFPGLKKFLTGSYPGIKLIAGHDLPGSGADWTTQSDGGAFFEKQIPFLYFGVEDHADYHKPSDDFENIDKEFFVKAVTVILDILKTIDNERELYFGAR